MRKVTELKIVTIKVVRIINKIISTFSPIS